MLQLSTGRLLSLLPRDGLGGCVVQPARRELPCADLFGRPKHSVASLGQRQGLRAVEEDARGLGGSLPR